MINSNDNYIISDIINNNYTFNKHSNKKKKNFFIFKTNLKYNKIQIKKAISNFFNYNLFKITTLIVKNKNKSYKNFTFNKNKKWKKVYISFNKNLDINFFYKKNKLLLYN